MKREMDRGDGKGQIWTQLCSSRPAANSNRVLFENILTKSRIEYGIIQSHPPLPSHIRSQQLPKPCSLSERYKHIRGKKQGMQQPAPELPSSSVQQCSDHPHIHLLPLPASAFLQQSDTWPWGAWLQISNVPTQNTRDHHIFPYPAAGHT